MAFVFTATTHLLRRMVFSLTFGNTPTRWLPPSRFRSWLSLAKALMRSTPTIRPTPSYALRCFTNCSAHGENDHRLRGTAGRPGRRGLSPAGAPLPDSRSWTNGFLLRHRGRWRCAGKIAGAGAGAGPPGLRAVYRSGFRGGPPAASLGRGHLRGLFAGESLHRSLD